MNFINFGIFSANISWYEVKNGAWGSVVVKALRY
jgi:hypothetical protein